MKKRCLHFSRVPREIDECDQHDYYREREILQADLDDEAKFD